MKLGIAGHLTRIFIGSALTPLLLLASFAVGLVALVTLPREEEPQISVPLVDIFVRADGLKAEDAVELVTEPLETIIKGIENVEHVYSQTLDDQAVVTARFEVGTSTDAAILRVQAKIRANFGSIPVGIPEPIIVARGIDDVAIVSVTLTPKPQVADRWTANGLSRLARAVVNELAKVKDVGLIYIVGEQPEEIRVEPDPEKLALYGITRPRSPAPTGRFRPGWFATRAGRSPWSPGRLCGPALKSAISFSPPAMAGRSMCAMSPISFLPHHQTKPTSRISPNPARASPRCPPSPSPSPSGRAPMRW